MPLDEGKPLVNDELPFISASGYEANMTAWFTETPSNGITALPRRGLNDTGNVENQTIAVMKSKYID